MPMLMSLEGPQLSRLDAIRGQLYDVAPRPFWRASAQLNGAMDTFRAHKWLLVASIIGGMWLAGSKTGRQIIGGKRRR